MATLLNFNLLNNQSTDVGLRLAINGVQVTSSNGYTPQITFSNTAVTVTIEYTYQPTAGTDTIELVKPHLDPALYEWQYPARSVLDEGGILAGASDWPVSTANVFQAIYQAETRQGPEGVLDASQRVPREAMLYAYTRNAARALKEQDRIGSIAPGKQADFALLDRDVLTGTAEEARDTKVLWTIVGGKTVYGAKP